MQLHNSYLDNQPHLSEFEVFLLVLTSDIGFCSGWRRGEWGQKPTRDFWTTSLRLHIEGNAMSIHVV